MREKISSLLDGEQHDIGDDEAFKQIDHDHELKQVWHNYHLIGAVLRNESGQQNQNLIDRIKKSLLDERHTKQRGLRSIGANGLSSRRWLPGLALAASLTIIVAASFYYSPTQRNTLTTDSSTTREGTSAELSSDLLNSYLINHGEFTGMTNMNGLMTYAKFVSNDSK